MAGNAMTALPTSATNEREEMKLTPEADRELLVLAAKAADVKYTDALPNWDSDWDVLAWDVLADALWNPLNDDGDALRLAFRLGMMVDLRYKDGNSRAYNEVTYWPDGAIAGQTIQLEKHKQGDSPSALRRAIVRAAAEIGRSMP
jgi:hypothetical protein